MSEEKCSTCGYPEDEHDRDHLATTCYPEKINKLNRILDWCEGEFKHFCIDTSLRGLQKRRAEKDVI